MHGFTPVIFLMNNYVGFLYGTYYSPFKLDVFQYLTDVEVNTTITDDLVNEVCHTT